MGWHGMGRFPTTGGQKVDPPKRRKNVRSKAITLLEGKIARATKSPVILSWEDAWLILQDLKYYNAIYLGRPLTDRSDGEKR